LNEALFAVELLQLHVGSTCFQWMSVVSTGCRYWDADPCGCSISAEPITPAGGDSHASSSGQSAVSAADSYTVLHAIKHV